MENQKIVNSHMNKELGTKWFTFYAKVRPWLGCFIVLLTINDFMQYKEIYMHYWWLMLDFLVRLVRVVFGILVYAKSKGDYEDFVDFVKGVLIFETISMSYDAFVQSYSQHYYDQVGLVSALTTGFIILLLGYFLWYRLNMKYFKKRIMGAFAKN